ncbi:MAG: RsmB/NOP family class I SAM-dependent RNA methyltransferase [Lachnospiraceae bacterium]|nr:RsmB/NOP family class I SAM-dependent RNA methyltransferase [Lachnospiraceae bacterium]
MRLPEEFENRMKDMLGPDYENYLASFELPSFQGLRVNTMKISTEDFLNLSPFKLENVEWCPNGFYYCQNESVNDDAMSNNNNLNDITDCTPGVIKPSKHPYYFAGLYYLQEPSAMTTASLLPVEPGDKVLDMCAAPGGKSTELAAKLNGTGLLVSNDISNSRAKALLKNLELFGAGNTLITSVAPNELSKHFPSFFDKILIDAPCSGEGMFRKQSNMTTAWENNGVELFVGLQKSILKEAVTMLKPGGRIIYSTCTFSPEENEQSIEYLLSLDDGLRLSELPLYTGWDMGHPEWGNTGNAELTKCRRIWPHRVKGEGHFVAMAEKIDYENEKDKDFTYSGYANIRSVKIIDNMEESMYRFSGEKLSKEAVDFINSINYPFDMKRMDVLKDKVYYIPKAMPDVKGLRILRCGLLIGEIKKNRFEPSQALAMFLKKESFDNSLSLKLEDDRVIRYLKGETIKLQDNENQSVMDGYVLICVDDHPLGFGKNSKGMIKNKYLPGWRMI